MCVSLSYLSQRERERERKCVLCVCHFLLTMSRTCRAVVDPCAVLKYNRSQACHTQTSICSCVRVVNFRYVLRPHMLIPVDTRHLKLFERPSELVKIQRTNTGRLQSQKRKRNYEYSSDRIRYILCFGSFRYQQSSVCHEIHIVSKNK